MITQPSRFQHDDAVSTALSCEMPLDDPTFLDAVEDTAMQEQWVQSGIERLSVPFTESVEHIVPLGQKTKGFTGDEIAEARYEGCVSCSFFL